MAIQMILCMETDKRAATDDVYITDTMKRFYVLDNKHKISKIYMGGKSKYKSNDVLNEIKKLTKDYRLGETRVIYCVDTDLYDVDVNHERELNEINTYCERNGYDLIWFCRDVEEVFVGKVVADDRKTAEAASFRRKKMIDSIPENRLNSKEKRRTVSNILDVLDKYMIRK